MSVQILIKYQKTVEVELQHDLTEAELQQFIKTYDLDEEEVAQLREFPEEFADELLHYFDSRTPDEIYEDWENYNNYRSEVNKT